MQHQPPHRPPHQPPQPMAQGRPTVGVPVRARSDRPGLRAMLRIAVRRPIAVPLPPASPTGRGRGGEGGGVSPGELPPDGPAACRRQQQRRQPRQRQRQWWVLLALHSGPLREGLGAGEREEEMDTCMFIGRARAKVSCWAHTCCLGLIVRT